jgi:hypothetical protein
MTGPPLPPDAPLGPPPHGPGGPDLESYHSLVQHKIEIDTAVSELVSVLAIIKGEVDLVVLRARRRVESWYAKHPEWDRRRHGPPPEPPA